MTMYLAIKDITSDEFLARTFGEKLVLLADGVLIDGPEKGKVEVTEAKLREVCVRVIDLVMKKNADYGDAWQRQGINGVLVRLADKLYRIDNLTAFPVPAVGPASKVEHLIASETVEDTIVDAIGYCLLGLLYIEENDV